MTKKDIVDILAATYGKKNHIQKDHLKDIVDCTFDAFIDLLANDGRMEIRNFGVFTVKKTPARVGRNPMTKEEAIVPARNRIQFKAGKIMKDLVQNHSSSEPNSPEIPESKSSQL